MAYETKVLLIALAQIVLHNDTEEAYNTIVRMANAEGIVIKPYAEAKAEMDAK